MVVTTTSPSAAPEAGSRHSRSPSRPHGGAGFRVRGQSVRAGPVPCFWESIRLRSLSRWPTLILGACLSIASQLGASRQLPSQLPTHLERRVRSRRKRAFVCPEPPLRRFAHSGGSAEIRVHRPRWPTRSSRAGTVPCTNLDPANTLLAQAAATCICTQRRPSGDSCTSGARTAAQRRFVHIGSVGPEPRTRGPNTEPRTRDPTTATSPRTHPAARGTGAR